MTIQTYAELQTAVGNWTHRADLTAIIPDLIALGELRIFREVRVRDMETAFTGTIAAGVVAVPADYLDIKFAYIASSPVSKLSRASASQIYDKYPLRTATDKPTLIAREGANFIFGPFPDSNYTIGGVYYAKPESISTSANALFLANPDLYLFAALCEAAPYMKDDPRIQLWEGKYGSIKQQLDFQDNQESSGGGGMTVRVA